jgi:hypothetical protein
VGNRKSPEAVTYQFGVGTCPNGVPVKSPRRVEAGRKNRQLRGSLSPAALQRLREAALRDRPWVHATGPRTEEGKRAATANGKLRQLGPTSVREARAELKAMRGLLATCAATRAGLMQSS